MAEKRRYQRKKRLGRPKGSADKFTAEVTELLLDHVSQGASIKTAASKVGISDDRVYVRLREDEDFSRRFDAALVAGLQKRAAELPEYAEETQESVKKTMPSLAPSIVAARKLYADTIKWMAERRVKGYSPKVTVGDNAGKVSIIFDIPAPSTKE